MEGSSWNVSCGPGHCPYQSVRQVLSQVSVKVGPMNTAESQQISQADHSRIWLWKAVFRSLGHSFRFWENKKPAIFVRWFLFVFSFVFSGICVVDETAIL
jgi:hypothetical protein